MLRAYGRRTVWVDLTLPPKSVLLDLSNTEGEKRDLQASSIARVVGRLPNYDAQSVLFGSPQAVKVASKDVSSHQGSSGTWTLLYSGLPSTITLVILQHNKTSITHQTEFGAHLAVIHMSFAKLFLRDIVNSPCNPSPFYSSYAAVSQCRVKFWAETRARKCFESKSRGPGGLYVIEG